MREEERELGVMSTESPIASWFSGCPHFKCVNARWVSVAYFLVTGCDPSQVLTV
jgi:hypothetical protein